MTESSSLTPDDAPASDVVTLMGQVLDRFRRSMDPDDWHGLRPSHFRVLAAMSPDCSRGVDLARALNMTKQGAGQLVATLVEGGWVQQVPDPHDGRARMLVRTEDGDTLVARRRTATAKLEKEWADEVGAADFDLFTDVLTRLSGGDSADDTRPNTPS